MSNISRRTFFVGLAGVGAAGLGLALASRPAAAAAGGTLVKVELWDKGAGSMDTLGSGPLRGFDEPGAKQAGATMGITATPATIKAGEVTFEAINNSSVMVHEMIVAPEPSPMKPLPYIKGEQRVDEEKADHLGEVSELAPGKSGALRITLKPGKYILYCNVPGHYEMGMWTEVTVVS